MAEHHPSLTRKQIAACKKLDIPLPPSRATNYACRRSTVYDLFDDEYPVRWRFGMPKPDRPVYCMVYQNGTITNDAALKARVLDALREVA
jgi:hypothetical protein